MGKGSRIRKERAVSMISAQRHLAGEDGKQLKRVVNKEINRQLAESHVRFYQNEISIILWCLHEILGLGRKRLKRFYDAYEAAWQDLKQHYESSDDDMPFIAQIKLRDIGVDLDEWKDAGHEKSSQP